MSIDLCCIARRGIHNNNKKGLGYHALENKLHRPQHSPTQGRRVDQHMQNNPHTGPKASKQAGASRSICKS